MIWFYFILLFIVAYILGFATLPTLTSKGYALLKDIWADIRFWFVKKVEKEPEELVCGGLHEYSDGIISQFRTQGGIKPKDGYITWYLDPTKPSKTISEEDAIVSIKESWSYVEPHMHGIKFKQVASKSQAQVVVGFWLNGQSGLPSKFNTNTLGYAFLGNGGDGKGITGDIFINDKFKFSYGLKPGYKDFKRVFLHESLHAVPGLYHQTIDRAGILYPTYNPSVSIKLSQDTIDGISAIYKKFTQGNDIPRRHTWDCVNGKCRYVGINVGPYTSMTHCERNCVATPVPNPPKPDPVPDSKPEPDPIPEKPKDCSEVEKKLADISKKVERLETQLDELSAKYQKVKVNLQQSNSILNQIKKLLN
jgi:hypothetical protein